MAMEIVDSQLHPHTPEMVAEADTDKTGSAHQLRDAPALIDMMDSVGVNAALLVPTAAFGFDLDYVLGATVDYPGRFAVIARANPDDPDLDATMQQLSREPAVLGVRVILWRDDELERLDAGGYEPVFAAAERHGVPVTTYPPPRLAQIANVAQAHPQLALVIDHLGLEVPRRGMPFPANPFEKLPDLLGLAAFENISVKCSAVPAWSREPSPFADIWPHIHEVMEAFGPERVMWGSDITRCTNHTYAEALAYMRDTDELSESEKRLVMGESLRRIFRWPSPAA
jgi:L-fuconolactonase